MTSPSDRVSTAEIAGLLAWARSLTEAGPAAAPTQRAAYLAAKAALPARVADQSNHQRLSTKDSP